MRTKRLRVLVSGSRWLVEYNLIHEKLDDIYAWAPKLTVLEGGAAGADHAAGSWAHAKLAEGADVEWVTYPANWKRYGKKAGPIRNRFMLEDGRPDMVLAFPYPDSKGTRDMISIARQAEGPSVIVIECGGEEERFYDNSRTAEPGEAIFDTLDVDD